MKEFRVQINGKTWDAKALNARVAVNKCMRVGFTQTVKALPNRPAWRSSEYDTDKQLSVGEYARIMVERIS